MRLITRNITIPILALGCSLAITANANEATEELFSLLDKGGCEPVSLTDKTWRISTSPVGTHGELILGDTLVFELIDSPLGIAKKSDIQIIRNGVIWINENGWTGQCVRDGTISQYVVMGDIELDGCLHELAIGRLDHDDGLSNKIEMVFHDSTAEKDLSCEGGNQRHPGHAHGTED